jgi:hypothetical protein
VALTASEITALTAAVPAATRMVARTGSRLARLWAESSRASIGRAAPLAIAEQPAIAATMVVKEGILKSHRLCVEESKLESEAKGVEKKK